MWTASGNTLTSNDLPAFDELDFILIASRHETEWGSADKFWISRQLFQENHVLIYGKGSPAARLDRPLDIAALENEYFIVMPKEKLLWSDITYSLCFDAGFYPKIYCQTDEFLVKVQLVSSGAAVAVIPESCLKDALAVAPGLAYAPLENYDTERSISLMRRKKSLMTEAAQDFWTFALDFYGLPEDIWD